MPLCLQARGGVEVEGSWGLVSQCPANGKLEV